MTRRVASSALAAALAAALIIPLTLLGAAPAGALDDPEHRSIAFPVLGESTYSADFGAPRGGGTRLHQGVDIFGDKLQKLVAATDATVTWMRHDSAGNAGNNLTLKDADGYYYKYIHINNDSPGTDDGANPDKWRFAAGLKVGDKVERGQHIAYLGDSGNAEGTSPHLHFEIRRPDVSAMNPYASLRLSQGHPVGDRCSFSSNPAPDPDDDAGRGYWALGADGGIFSFGSAAFFGSTGAMTLKAPVVGMAPTPTGKGYWLVARDGGIFSYGDAAFHGSTGAMELARPVVGMATMPEGRGYWLVAADGGLFTFGKGAFHGSLPERTTADGSRVVGMEARPDGSGYWMLQESGRVTGFGETDHFGDVARAGLCHPRTARDLASSLTHDGYWIVTEEGRVWEYGDAPHAGDMDGTSLRGEMIGIAPVPAEPEV